MKIAILTLGTRGDVQPYAILGQALQRRGHKVTLSTAQNFEKLVRSYGIDFIPVEADYQAILQSDEGKKIMKANPLAIQRNLNQWIYPLVSQSLQAFYELAKDSDRVIYHVKTLADSFADQFPEKMIRAMVVPAVQPTSAFANPAFSGFAMPAFLNKLSYKLTNLSIRMLRKPIRQFRSKMGLSKDYEVPDTKFIYGISRHFLEKPNDFPEHAIFTGFWHGTDDKTLSTALNEFLKAGEPPLLITFGSMPFKSRFDLQTTIFKLAEQLNSRIIVVKGWGIDKTERFDNQPHIKVISDAPYDQLFPQVKAIVHHGGIGTTAACLKAGKPFLICPILHPVGDQNFWGQIAFKKGLGPKPVPLSKMSEKMFIESIKTLLSNETLYENAKHMQQLLATEHGIEVAVAEIEKANQ